MNVKITCGAKATHIASDMLLGQNIEAAGDVIAGLLSDRLDNPKFLGPANPMTGIAPGWQPYGNNMGGIMCALTPGMSLTGNESQLIHTFAAGTGILQTNRSVRAGETLELEIWAKVRHHPVNLLIMVGAHCPRKPEYFRGTVRIDAAYWKPYRLTMTMPADDDAATFFCLLEEEGYIWIDQMHLRPAGEGHVCREMVERIKTLHMPVLRFPGGCISTNYHWRCGTGPVHLRPALADPVFQLNTSYDFGTDEYLELCHNQGVCPMITVNIGSGTPDEAHDWAAYVADWYRGRGVQPPQAYFQMGNEHYGAWETAHMTADMYVNALREFVPAVKSAYPNSRILALGEEVAYGLRAEHKHLWRKTVLDKAADLIDVLTLSRYKGQWYDSPLDKQINVAESVTKVQKDIEEMIADCRATGRDIKVGITEWNYWLHATHWGGDGFQEPYDAQHALYVARVLNMFARLGADMEVATFYHLVNPMGMFVHRGAGVQEACLAELFRMYRPAFSGEFVPVAVDSPRLGETEAAVDALCLKNGKDTWLFVINTHPSQPAAVTWQGLPMASRETSVIAATSPLDPLEKVTPPKVGPAGVELPPLSVARFRIA